METEENKKRLLELLEKEREELKITFISAGAICMNEPDHNSDIYKIANEIFERCNNSALNNQKNRESLRTGLKVI